MAGFNFLGKKFNVEWNDELFKMIGMGALLFYCLRFAKLIYDHYSTAPKEDQLCEEHKKEAQVAAAAAENTETKTEEVVKSAGQKKEE